MIRKVICFVVFLNYAASNLFSQTFDLFGQLSAWMVTNQSTDTQLSSGFRYIPAINFNSSIKKRHQVDFELSYNVNGNVQVHNRSSASTDWNVKLYRLWLRYATSQLELRLGLQKINFGAAVLLRSLMWFDSIDPRDPLHLTTGVYGLLCRYYFLNNANIWLWGLYGNDHPKGWEAFPSAEKKPEFGGRIQTPLFKGEIAVSYHHRTMYLGKSIFAQYLFDKFVPEDRFAIDGKWDVGIGLWIETAISHQQSDMVAAVYQKMTTLGLDYTIGWRNGLHILAEHLTVHLSDRPFAFDQSSQISAISIDYPLGLVDQLMGMVYYDWDNDGWYRFLSWQRVYDAWSFHVIGFWNPPNYMLYQKQEANEFMGKGIQLMIVFNH